MLPSRRNVLIACAFNFRAVPDPSNKLGAPPVLEARMNANLHMADDLANTGKQNLFVILGKPAIESRRRTARIARPGGSR